MRGRPEDIAAWVNGLLVLILPLAFLVAGGVIVDADSDDSVTVRAPGSPGIAAAVVILARIAPVRLAGEGTVIDPPEAARRIMAEAQSRRPERPLTLKEFTPARMRLAYLSMPRRQEHRLLEPGWSRCSSPGAPPPWAW